MLSKEPLCEQGLVLCSQLLLGAQEQLLPCRNSGFLGSDAHVWKYVGAPGAAFLFPAVLRCRWVFLCLQHTALFDLFQDLPSFTQNVHRLVNDLRYYRLCNDSLPPGTVKL